MMKQEIKMLAYFFTEDDIFTIYEALASLRSNGIQEQQAEATRLLNEMKAQ